MKIGEIKIILDDLLQVETQEDWDNSGLILGDENSDVNSCLVALELTKDVVASAIKNNNNIIITHHPGLFSPIKVLTKKYGKENFIFDLVRNNIALYCAHTNFDKLVKGMDSYIGRLIGGKNFQSVEGSEYGVIFEVDKKSARDIGKLLIDILELSHINAIGNIESEITKIIVVTGSGSDSYSFAKKSGADLFITGDIKYHFAQDVLNDEIVVFDIGHYDSEKIFPQVFEEKCKLALENLNIEYYAKNQNPFTLILGRE